MEVNQLSQSKKRVLEVAERHFMERGYSAVTLFDVAEDLSIKQASLYYHAPGGKQELFEQVIRFAFERHGHGIRLALDRTSSPARSQLEEVIGWLSSQPRLPFMRIVTSDLENLEQDLKEDLQTLGMERIFEPICRIFSRGIERGELRDHDPELVTRAFLSVVSDVGPMHSLHWTATMRESASVDLLDIFFGGLKRAQHTERMAR